MKSVIALWLTILVGVHASAESRERFEGQTQIEREIRWSWKYLKDVANSCLASQTECQDPEIRKVIQELDSYLPGYETAVMQNWSKLLSFVSEKDHPDAFTSVGGETHRLAVTEFKKNSVVMINTDRMSRPLKEWIGLLGHEATHHLGYADDDKRLPDRVGAELMNHFQKRALESTLEEFNRPDIRSFIFNSSGARLTAGFFSSREITVDVEWGPTSTAPLCAGAKIERQFVGNPVWHLNFIKAKTGVVTLRAGGFVNLKCAGVAGVQQALLGGQIQLRYKAPLDLNNWLNETPELVDKTGQLGASLSPPDVMWGPNQSFWVESVKHSSAQLTAGDKWETEILVKSSDGWIPQTCEVYLSGTNWPYWGHVSMPAVAMFENCKITNLGGGRYQLNTSYSMPAAMQPDDFYISLIRFPGSPGDRYAVASRPDFVHVANPKAKPAAVITSVKYLDVTSATSAAGIPLTNSYQAENDHIFRVEVNIKGEQEISNLQVDMPLWGQVPQGIGNLFLQGPVKDFPPYFPNVSITKVAGGTKIILQVKMVPELVGYQIVALQFARIFAETSDFAWVEVENAKNDDTMIVNSRFAH